MSTFLARSSWLRLWLLLLVGAILAVGVYYSPAYFIPKANSAPVNRLKASGTSVVSLIIDNSWRQGYRAHQQKNNSAGVVQVDYASVGSSKGIEALLDNKTPLAFVHAPLSPTERAKAKEKGGEVVHVPIVVCAVVPIFNIPELLPELQDNAERKGRNLNFSGEVLADIFLGKITKWNDPRLKALQPADLAEKLPDRNIYVVQRDDSSGTTLVFTEFLSQTSTTWAKDKEHYGTARSKVDWPVGVPMSRSMGVADCVKKTKYSIGYVDLVHVWDDTLPGGALTYGAVLNPAGKYIHADAANMTSAVKEALPTINDDLQFQLTNRPGADSYPITGLIWAVTRQSQPEEDRKRVVDFLQWVTHDGQKTASRMSYAPLPEQLVERAEQKIQSLQASH